MNSRLACVFVSQLWFEAEEANTKHAPYIPDLERMFVLDLSYCY